MLSLLSVPTDDRVARLLGEASGVVLAEGLRVGFLTEHPDGSYSIHPLLREFLHQKLLQMSESSRAIHLARGLDFLLAEELWEEAFTAVRGFGLTEQIEPVLRKALYHLLDRGLLGAVSEFVQYGRQHLAESAVLDLAAAELAFRTGFHQRSLDLAESAAYA